MTATESTTISRRFLPDQRTIWRWHFYAGLFCIPFVMWLSVTGGIYLFKPQIEAWMDRPYDGLLGSGETSARPEVQVQAALATVPGSNLHFYELPRRSGGAAQIIVGKGEDEFRVYVHPVTAAVLKIDNEDQRPMIRIFHLHGELMAGDRGSLLVELAASWAVVMILTGLALWWPAKTDRLAGVLYPRLTRKGRVFWRDLHSVTGLWVSFFALFLLFTGLPWAKSWGNYLKKVRGAFSSTVMGQDWTTGRSSELAQRMARNMDSMPGHENHVQATNHGFGKKARMRLGAPGSEEYRALDTILPAVVALHLAHPAQISPPLQTGGPWIAKSDSQDRTLRDSYTMDATSAAILKHERFGDRPLGDRIIGLGISAHEGHLFGIVNQLLGFFTAVGLFLVAVSSIVMWWRRRPVGLLGAPLPSADPYLSKAFVLLILVFAIYLPLLGVSIIAVAVVERLVLQRIPAVALWLGIRRMATDV
jgi:uncharacterized iron-regulated membrane protein